MNRRLADLAPRLKARPEAVIEYFVPDERKAGGMYVSETCVVRKVKERLPVMEDGTEIPLAPSRNARGVLPAAQGHFFHVFFRRGAGDGLEKPPEGDIVLQCQILLLSIQKLQDLVIMRGFGFNDQPR